MGSFITCTALIKSRIMGWAGYVTRMGVEKERVYVVGGNTIGKETTRRIKT
jgi:hypothetical protein